MRVGLVPPEEKARLLIMTFLKEVWNNPPDNLRLSCQGNNHLYVIHIFSLLRLHNGRF